MKIVGHRGAKGLAPENTIASFEKALEHHVDEIELDVRVTSDGLTVLSHDAHVSDPGGNHIEVATHTFAELQVHKPNLVSLEDAIRLVDRRVPIIVEVKPSVPTAPVIAIINKLLQNGWKPADLHLSSYSQAALLELHEALPDVQKIVIENWSGVRASRRANRIGSKRISMLEVWLWSGFVRAMSRRGYQIYSFPSKTPQKERFFSLLGLGGFTNNPAKARRWAKYGLAGVITDYPDLYDK